MKSRRVTRKMRSRARKYRGRTRRGGMPKWLKSCFGASCATNVAEPVARIYNANSPLMIKLNALMKKYEEISNVIEVLTQKQINGQPVSDKEIDEAHAAFDQISKEVNEQQLKINKEINKVSQAIMGRNIGRTTTAEQAELNAELAALEAEENPTPHP